MFKFTCIYPMLNNILILLYSSFKLLLYCSIHLLVLYNTLYNVAYNICVGVSRHGPKVPKICLHVSVFWNTRTHTNHTSAYNIFCSVASNLNSSKILKAQSQFISTRAPTGLLKMPPADLNNSWVLGSPAKLFKCCSCVIRNQKDWTISIRLI